MPGLSGNRRTISATGMLLFLCSRLPAQQVQEGPCLSGPCLIGQWSGPFELGISCGSGPPCNLARPINFDEIAHAALLPVGNWAGESLAGRVLLWTACDKAEAERGSPYRTYVWDPTDPMASLLESPVLERISNNGEDGPFCAGHTWVLDDTVDRNAKLLTAGGNDRAPFQDPAPGFDCAIVAAGAGGFPPRGCGLNKVFWFDPLASDPLLAWKDQLVDGAPLDLPISHPVWYPVPVPFLPSPGATRFDILLVGGSALSGAGCGFYPTTSLRFQYQGWWTLTRPLAGSSWVQHAANSSYSWQYYDRGIQLTTGQILAAGHAIVCEEPLLGWNSIVPPAHPYGGVPVNRIDLSTDTYLSGPDPNDLPVSPAEKPGALDYCNTVVLHTLKNRKVLAFPAEPLSNYDVDRVIVSGGGYEVTTSGNQPSHPQPLVLEYSSGAWLQKASPAVPRYGAYTVPLPDGTLLLEGGIWNINHHLNIGARFEPSVQRFDPQLPGQPGIWTTMAPRPVVEHPVTEELFAPARGYHHVALMLKDGSVAVLGGREALQGNEPWDSYRSSSSVELYKPPYFFQSNRLKIMPVPTAVMHYDSEYCITVDRPGAVDWACLIGAGSVTHFFDTGARYVELMALPCSSGGNIKLRIPPDPRMAPEGYYLLFVVEDRDGVRIPSKGVFVKLTF